MLLQLPVCIVVPNTSSLACPPLPHRLYSSLDVGASVTSHCGATMMNEDIALVSRKGGQADEELVLDYDDGAASPHALTPSSARRISPTRARAHCDAQLSLRLRH